MFYITVWGKAVEDWNGEEVQDNLYALSDSTVLLNELMELLCYRFEQIDFIDEPVVWALTAHWFTLHLYPRSATGGDGFYETCNRA